jgi:DNA repair protein RadA/Sms
MVKSRSVFTCNNCSYKTVKWLGCCPDCKMWETIQETTEIKTKTHQIISNSKAQLHTIESIPEKEHQRFTTNYSEWDRVAGGGIVAGSFTLISGDPGVGKSTLLLQIANELAKKYKVIYFSTEESLSQVKIRFIRTQTEYSHLLLSDASSLEEIIETSKEQKPALIVVDSIQNVYSSENFSLPGTITQLKETSFHLMKLAKQHDIAIIATGHITKDGNIAGPKMLEHMVDAVFYLQKEEQWHTRILRSIKNRFGSIQETGFFSMEKSGLQEIKNINQYLINETKHAPGSILISSLQGTRPIFLELQALTVASQFGSPQRIISGIDHKHVVLIAAILEKYLHIQFSKQDIFFKVSGGLTLRDHTTDLGVAFALLSSYFQQPLPEKTIALAELSLTGQVKSIPNIDVHVQEAARFGFENLLVAREQHLATTKIKNIKKLTSVYDLLLLFPEIQK